MDEAVRIVFYLMATDIKRGLKPLSHTCTVAETMATYRAGADLFSEFP